MDRSRFSFLVVAAALVTAGCDNSPVGPASAREPGGSASRPAFSLVTSATNGKIAFNNPGTVIMNLDGSDRTGLNGSFASWSPDGKKLAYTCGGPGGWGRICTSNPDGTGLSQLTTDDAEADDVHPGWSPDGTRIVWERNGSGVPMAFYDGPLYIMNADGSGQTPLGVDGHRPQWSPDGKTILFGKFFSSSVWMINPDGTNLREIPLGLPWVHWPAWSPDGSKNVFTARPDYLGLRVYVMNADGSNATPITSADHNAYHPAWSPDGTKIAFAYSGLLGEGGALDLFTTSPDGTNLTQITFDGDNTYQQEGNTYPSWQPIPTAVFPFTGFFKPIGPAGKLNSVKAGSSVPVKFSLGGNLGLNIFADGSPSTEQIACKGAADTDSSIDDTEAAGASGLKYDAKSKQYTYAWKTDKSWKKTCRRLTVTLTDGTSHTADFMFK
jgi:dipeptidyl aminopeptidase/acylaminoacyl peptidase